MANTFIFANNAGSTFAGSISNTALSLNLQAGGGALFPNPTTGQVFQITAIDAATGLLREIMQCTARSADTLTVVRAQEGTTALAWNAGDLVQELWTAGQAGVMLQTSQSGTLFQPPTTQVMSFTSTTTFTVPAGKTQINDCRVWGGGGGGGGCGLALADAGAGGGSGGYAEQVNIPVTPGQVITVTIGAGGSGGTSTTAGGTGGTTSFGSFCSASGGSGGTAGTSGIGVPGGTGGATFIGQFTVKGNNGGSGIGIPSPSSAVSGAGGGAPFVGSSASGNQGAGGSTGTFPGGGGNGGSGTGTAGNNGGAGAAGLVVIEF